MAVKYKIPGSVSKETTRFIKDVLKELNSKDAIQDIDLGALNMLTVSYEMYMQASERLLVDGPLIKNKYEDIIPHPAQTIATKNYGQVMKIMTEYGLTIKSRGQIKAVSTEDKEDSPIEKFIEKR